MQNMKMRYLVFRTDQVRAMPEFMVQVTVMILIKDW